MSQIECGFDSSPGNQGTVLLIQSGPTLLVNIGMDTSWTPASRSVPVPGISGVKALVDTGATECCIDQLLAASINLPIVDRVQIAGISGQHIANIYLAQIFIPGIGITHYGRFAGVSLKAGGQAHEALIGRSLLQHFHMTYVGNTGAVTLTKLI
jgi:predicted aspartyl protease